MKSQFQWLERTLRSGRRNNSKRIHSKISSIGALLMIFFGEGETEFVDIKEDAFLALTTSKDDVYVGEGFNTTLSFFCPTEGKFMGSVLSGKNVAWYTLYWV